MNLKVLATTVAATLLGCWHLAGSAQPAPEQTIENAQRFLELTLPGKPYYPSGIQVLMADMRHEVGGTVSMEGRPTIVDAAPMGRCMSKFLYEYSPSVMFVHRRAGRVERHQAIAQNDGHLKGILGPKNGVHWSNLIEVKKVGTEVRMRFSNVAGPPATVDLRSESLADRVAYALEFLRIRCDKASSTGF